MASPAAVQLPPPATATDPQQPGSISFRQATTERSAILQGQTAVTLNAGTQQFEDTIDGSGFIYGIVMRASATAAGNAAAVAFAEDAPFNIYDRVNFHDVNGQIIDVSGFGLYLANLMNGDYRFRDPTEASNTQIFNLVPGAGANGGSFAVTLRVPVAINRRDLIGILGNQDRAQSYGLTTPISASTTLYTVAPTALPTVSVDLMYESYTVPLGVAPSGQRQMQMPPMYGSIRSITRSLSEAAPLGGSTVNHYVRRIGQVIRGTALVFRLNSSRAAAAAVMPSQIRVLVGDEPIFNEPSWYRQLRNWEAYGNRMPNGVLIYENLHDFMPGAGYELGNDWWHTQIVQNMQFQNTYPAGFGSTGNSLEIITDDIVLRSPVMR